jgi:dipeptidyl aminopeptidase/acylaminoacyl peptidase
MKLKLSVLFLLTLSGHGFAQENLTYQKPSKEILDLADYQRAPSVLMDTKKEWMLLTYRNTYKTLDDLNQEEMRLGGLRINPITNISSAVTYSNNLKVRRIKDKNEIQVEGLPQNPKITNLSWSPDETKVAFSHTTAAGVELWFLDIALAKATKLTEATVNANLGNPFNWYRDGQSILVKMIPKNRPALIDLKKELPAGPIVSTSEGKVSQNRTYPDMLKNKTDETNFENLVSSELYKVNLSGQATLYKSVDMYIGESFSPDGTYLMVTTIQKPFSYIVPLSRFPQKNVVYDLNGNAVKTVNEVPLTEVMPKGFSSVRKGKRSMNWRSDKPAMLTYVEALDEGDQAKKVDFRDEVFLWDAPFSASPTSLLKTPQRFAGMIWGNDNVAIAYDDWYDTRNTKTYLINPSNAAQAPKIISNRNSQDIYSDPGNFETIKNQYGRQVLALENNSSFLIGDGFTKNGQFPFIDEFNIKTLKTKRLYQSNYTDKKEQLLSIEDFKKGDALVIIQSKNDYPNYYFRNFKKKDQLTPITDFKNPFESILTCRL